MSKSHDLFTLKEFNKLHHKQNLSVVQIAEKYDTYPNKVRRLAKKLGAELRNKSEAQKVALESGRQEHPTEGKGHSLDTKVKISERVAENWDGISDKERKRRAKVSQDNWNSLSEAKRHEIRSAAHRGIKQAANKGSKLELFLLEELIREGFKVRFHVKHLIANEKMHLDMILPDLKTVIEVDGPSHFQNIWGKKTLSKSRAADLKKDGLLLGAGFCIVRVFQKKDLSEKLKRDILIDLVRVLRKIETKFPPVGERKFVVGD